MFCPRCHREIGPGARLCIHCGATTGDVCSSCGSPVSPEDRFCRLCGTEIIAAARAEAERRQLTVMFCDLVDSSGLGQRLDPEDLREVIDAYQENCARVAEQFQGHVHQRLGDGVLVFFGYPQAHEDDAERAIRDGLAILSQIAADR